MSNIMENSKRYVRSQFGNLITVGEPILDKYNERWLVTVKSYYPRITEDNESNERILNILTLDKLCYFYYNLNGIMVKAPSKEECLESLKLSLNLWKERVERIVTKASSKELSNVQTVRHFLRPVEVIVNYVYHYDVLENYEIENLTRTQRYLNWINLLLELRLLEKTVKGYTYGDTWVALKEKYQNKDEFMDIILSILISERYSYIREIMNVEQLGTVIHSNCCYYKSCIEADKIVKRHPESIWKDYVKYYGTKSYAEIFNTLLELSEAKVLLYAKPYFNANEEIYDRIEDYQINKSIIPPI